MFEPSLRLAQEPGYLKKRQMNLRKLPAGPQFMANLVLAAGSWGRCGVGHLSHFSALLEVSPRV